MAADNEQLSLEHIITESIRHVRACVCKAVGSGIITGSSSNQVINLFIIIIIIIIIQLRNNHIYLIYY